MYMKMSSMLRDMVYPMLRRPKGLQVAALCHRDTAAGKQVLLVTSRGTGRWIIPKGWPIRGKSEAEAALQEAWEEAGVEGSLENVTPIGRYAYDKILTDGLPIPVEALVYSVAVDSLSKVFPECSERTRKWVSPDEAGELVEEPDLKALLQNMA